MKLVLSRGTYQKSLGKGWGVYHSKSSISRFHRTCPVNPSDCRETHRTCPVVALDLSGLGPASRDILPDSREVHRTYLVGSLPMTLYMVGAINIPPPTPWGHWPLRKHGKLPWDPFPELSPLSLRFTLDSYSWEKIWALFSVPPSGKSTSPSPSTTLLHLLLLGI
jgi:hypothetical protein